MKIQYPERGQPLDIDYLYQMAKSINSLHDKMVGSKTLSSIFVENQQQSLSTNMVRFYSTQIKGPTNATTTKVEEVTVNFNTVFTRPPVVTCTVQNNNSSVAGTEALVTIKNITTTSVQFNIKFYKAGASDITLNVIAVGV